MKINYPHMFIIITIISLGLAQCVSSVTIPPTNTSENPATPTLTITSTQTQTLTQTHIATLSFLPLPTLNPEEEQATILTLLKSNNGCDLPCWWGITPGKTTKLDTEQILRGLNLNFLEYIPQQLVGVDLPGLDKAFLLHFPDGTLGVC